MAAPIPRPESPAPRRESPAPTNGSPAAPPWPGTVRPISLRDAHEDYYWAVVAAGRAPSAHDTQPWRWQVTGGALDLLLAHQRPSRSPDPDGRLATISCGAALHHARLALAARGWSVSVARRPVTGDPAHLARLLIAGKAPVSADTAGLARSMDLPRTDQRPVTGDPVGPATLRAVSAAVEAQDVRVGVLTPAQILRLGVDDGTATLVVLHGPDDRDVDWLRAGEALSAGSLVAAGLGWSLRPLSAPIEQAVPEFTHPYLILRLGRPATETVVPHASRPTTTETVDLLSLVTEPE